MENSGPRGDLDELFGRRSGRGEAEPGGPGGAAGGLNPELASLVRQFEDASRTAEQLAGRLSERQFNWSPGAGQWSVAGCLGHLNLVGSELLPEIDGAIAQARSRAWYRSGPPRVGFFGRRLIETTEPPVRSKRRAKAEHVVAGEQAADVALPAFLDLNAQLVARVRAGNGFDLGHAKVKAFGSAVFKLSLYELLLFVAAHERRHLRQAQAVRDDPGFPKRVAGPSPAAPRPAR